MKRYLSAYNEYCEVILEGTYINIKLIIGNQESGTGNWFLVPYLRKRLENFKTVKSENVSKVLIGNKEPVPGSLFTIFGFILVSGFFYFSPGAQR